MIFHSFSRRSIPAELICRRREERVVMVVLLWSVIFIHMSSGKLKTRSRPGKPTGKNRISHSQACNHADSIHIQTVHTDPWVYGSVDAPCAKRFENISEMENEEAWEGKVILRDHLPQENNFTSRPSQGFTADIQM